METGSSNSRSPDRNSRTSSPRRRSRDDRFARGVKEEVRREGKRANDDLFPSSEVNTMQLVEQHVINRHDPRYSVIDEAAFKSKNLYNAALYELRQAFFHKGKNLNYNGMDRRMQSHKPSKALQATAAHK